MASNPNTQTLKQVWQDQYQLSHYKQPVFRALAYEKELSGMLRKGDTIHWSYMSDFYVEDMGGDGSYTTQAQTDTDETLVINKTKDVAFYEFEKDLEQAHYAVKVEYAKKAMNKVWLQIDADVLLNAYQGASTAIDNGIVTGGASNGTPIVPSVTNIFTMFTYADLNLRLNNVTYDPTTRFTQDVKLEQVTGMPVAVISAQVRQQILLYIGGKTTLLGDDITRNGHIGYFMGFELFMSNQLPCTVKFTFATLPSNNDTFTINGMTFTFVSVIGSTAGNILILDTIAHQQTLMTNIIASLFANSGATGAQNASTDNWVPFAVSAANKNALQNLSISSWSSNAATITQTGLGVTQVTSVTFTSGNNSFGKVVQHNIFGVSRSVGLVIQRYPRLWINVAPVNSSGVSRVGKDYVTWVYYGIKVFTYMKPQLIDVQIDTTGFTQPTITVN